MNYFEQETERLRFRKLTLDDVPLWAQFYSNNDRLHFVGADPNKDHFEQAQKWIEKQQGRYRDYGLGHMAVLKKDTDEFIGMGGVLTQHLDGQLEYEVAYSLIPKHWGKGYAKEIAQQMKAYAITHLKPKRLISIIDKNNIASEKVAQSIGFKVLEEREYRGLEVFIYGKEW